MKDVVRSHIPLANPLASYLAHELEIDGVIREILHRGHYILGEATAPFEEEFAGAWEMVGWSSGMTLTWPWASVS